MRTSIVIAVACIASPLPLLADDEDSEETDPRDALVDYHGSGLSEHEPEYGEAYVTFSVKCRPSATDVRDAIQKVSKPIWAAILKEVPEIADAAKDFTETRARFSGEVGNITESSGSRYKATAPTVDPETKVVTAGKLERFDACTGAPLALDAKVAPVFSGNQRFGVRTDKLDWLEGLLKTVNADKSRGSKEPGAVEFSATEVDYKVTRKTQEDMLLEVQTQARDAATGPDSVFTDDKKTFRFTSAIPIGRRPSFLFHEEPIVGQPLKRGAAPKVSLTVELLYSIYAESKNVIAAEAAEAAEGDGGIWNYPLTGTAILDADFAESTIFLSTDCHASAADAAQALTVTADEAVEELRAFHGKQDSNETDRVTQQQPAAPNPMSPPPYMPLAWDTTQPGFPVKTYLNTCTFKEVPAPASGQVEDLPPAFETSQVVTIRSKRFENILGLVEKLQTKYNIAETSTDAVSVRVGDAVAAAAEATKHKLERMARADAAKQAMDPKGQVATDARAFRYTRALFRGLGATPLFRKALRGAEPAFAPLNEIADASGLSAEELEVEFVKLPDEERPVYRMVRHYDFRYQVQSENYAELPEWQLAAGKKLQR